MYIYYFKKIILNGENMKIKALILSILLVLCIGLVACDEEAIPSQSSSENEHTHSYAKTVVPPTCTEQGYTIMKCDCGSEGKSEYVDPLGHTLGEWKTISTASCTEDGRKEQYCTVCEELVNYETTSKLNHYYTTKTVAPSCEAQGYNENVCKTCGYTYNNGFVPKTDCVAGDPVVVLSSTCKNTGKQKYYCKSCNKELKEESLSVISCSYMAYPIEKTDEKEAHTLYVCISCGDSYEGPYISKEALTQKTAKEIYAQSKNALVEILTYDRKGDPLSIGTGFFISADGYIATNYHVVRGAHSASIVKYAGGSTITSIKIVAYSIEEDVAILKIDASNQTYLEFATKAPETGDNIYALGSSLGLTDTFTYGMVSNPSRYINGKNCIQFTAPISSGNSGGPLIDNTGKVVGIVTMTVEDAQNINFAIKASTVTGVYENKLQTPLDFSGLYQETLSDSACVVWKYHIMNNYTEKDDYTYYIYSYEPQTQTSLAREYYFIYDSLDDKLYLQIDIVASLTGMNRLSITVELDETHDGKYAISMYDYEYSQATIIGYVNHSIVPKMMASYDDQTFNKLFSNIEIKYLETDTNNQPSKMKLLLYQSYLSLISKFSNILLASGTTLSLDTFNIKLPS